MVDPHIVDHSGDEECLPGMRIVFPQYPRLPREIMDAIIHQAEGDTEVLRKCRLASHAMSKSARPLVHRKIVLTNAVQCQNFYRLCCDITDIPSLVRELHVQGSDAEGFFPTITGINILEAAWTGSEASLTSVLASLQWLQRLYVTSLLWEHISRSLVTSHLNFISMRALCARSTGSVASCMRAAPLLREIEIRNGIFLGFVESHGAPNRPGRRIESLTLDNHLAIQVMQMAMDPQTLHPFSLRHLKRLSIHVPAPYDCVIIEDLVHSSEGPLEELTLLAPDKYFGIARSAARFERVWRLDMPSFPILPSRIPLRILRFQMVDYSREPINPLHVLMWLTRFLAKETGTISLERITIEVILADPTSVYLCLNSEVWRNWDKVLSRSNVMSLNSVHVILRALFDSPDLIPPSSRRMEDLSQHIIHCMPRLESNGVLRVDR